MRLLPTLAAAIVFPCDQESLQLAMSGVFAGFIAPTLVGPEARIRDLAGKFGLDISRLPIIDTPNDPRVAGEHAARLARSGEFGALVKGSLGIEELLAPVAAAESGLRSDRRLTHAYFLDLPGQNRGVLLADAQMNVAPNLAAKRDIVHNTVLLAKALGLAAPNVALLAAMDGPTPSFRSTTDAVALKAMAMQGLFPGAVVDGPLGPDSALSPDAARARGVKSDVAGRADILIGPSMESAIMVLRTLTGLTSGLAAGVVLGATIPIVAPARHESMEVRMASCVLASLLSASRSDDTADASQRMSVADTGARVAA